MTNVRDDDDIESQPPQRTASPEATGGIGTSYEQICAAVYYSALLTRSHATATPGIVTSVALQQKLNGRLLDDILIGWKDDGGREGTVDLQLKRSLSVSLKEGSDFCSIVTDAWATMKRSDFVDRRDLAGGLTEKIASNSYFACKKLRDLAAETDPEGFKTAVKTQTNAAAQRAHDAVQTILERLLGATPGPEDTQFFWRNFVIGRMEVTSHLDIDRLRTIDQLRPITPRDGVNPMQLFPILEALARQLNIHAGRVDRDMLITLLAERFGTHLMPIPDDLSGTLEISRQGASLEMESFRSDTSAQLIEPLFTIREGDGQQTSERTVHLDAIEAELRASRSLILTGEPGAGKSSALSQIAVTLHAHSKLISILRSLPSLALNKISIVTQICGKGSFSGLSEASFASLARSAQIVLLFDGWNELNAEQRQWAWSELEALRRDYPALLLVVATRTGTANPFSRAKTLEIQPFDRTRQLEAAACLIGPAGHDMVIRARAISALRPLMRTPIFLSAILQQGDSGQMPSNRETVIAGLVSGAGGTPARRERLRLALDNQHQVFLQAIAEQLMHAGTTFLSESALLPHIGEVAGNLRTRQLLVQPISSQSILDLLISHHLLVGTGAPGERTISFQHQLIQEWFASFCIQRSIENQLDGKIDTQLVKLLDAPFWSVTILFAVDRVNRLSSALVPMRALILTTLGIDPFLAAEIYARAEATVADTLDEELVAFAERWVAEDSLRATQFMLATGLKQFSEHLWATLQKSKQLAFHLHRTGGRFRSSALRPHWDRNFPKLDDQTRRVLLIDLIQQGDAGDLELCLRSAAKDPCTDVVSGVVDFLDFYDERSSLNRLLDTIPKSVWVFLARRPEPENLADRHRSRWQQYRRERFKSAEGFEWINLALEFDCAAPAAIIDATLDLKSDNHWSSYAVEQTLFERFPSEFQASLVSRLLCDGRLPYRAWQYLVNHVPSEQAALTAIALDKDGNFHRRQLAAQLLGRESIAELIEHMISCEGDSEAMRSRETQEICDALRNVRLELLVTDILNRTTTDAQHAAALIAILADWRGPEDERSYSIPARDRELLIQRSQDWAALFLAEKEVQRSDLAELARVIDRLADVVLLPALMLLWDRDRTQRAEERAANAIDPDNPRASEAMMGYGNQYRSAALSIGGDAVIEAMIDKLDDPDCEHDAAVILGQLLEVDPVQRGPMGFKIDDLAIRHAQLLKRRASAPHPVAARLIDRIDTLVEAGDINSITRAFQLAGPVTLMNYGNRGPRLLNLIEVGKSSGLLADFCKAFSERGEPLPAQIIRHGIAENVAALSAMKWVHENDLWRLNRWLHLIAFADDVEAALPSIDELPAEFVRDFRLRDLVRHIGYSISPTAVSALEQLQRRSPDRFIEGWPQAVAKIGSRAAGNALLDAILTASEDAKIWRDTYGLRQALAATLAAPGEVRTRAFSLLGEIQHEGKRTALADALAQTMNEEDAMQLLIHAIEPDGDAIARILVGRLEHAAVTRLPIEGSTNTFELEGAALPQLRQLAFRELQKNPTQPVLRRCLQAIDHLRDEYGKPATEPNHPDIGSGRAWPSAADPLWTALDCGVEGENR